MVDFRADYVYVRKAAGTEPTSSTINEAYYTANESAATVYDDLKIFPQTGQAYLSLYSISETEGATNAGTLKYQISNNGTNWYYHNGTAWTAVSDDVNDNNTMTEINSYFPAFTSEIGIGNLFFKAL